VTVIAATFVATTNTSTVLASVNLLTSGNLDSNTHFNCPVGVTMFNASESADTSEANSKNRQRKAMTASNLFIQIIQAGGGNPITFRSRKNAANGNMVISASASQTGLLQETITH
jgi:thymidine phosphorylase